jgi:acetamidase/formamidase
MRTYAAVSIGTIALSAALAAQNRAPKTHRLEATPATVAYGYYWSEAKPVLRIASGDIIDVDTLLTNSPAGLERAGVAPAKIQDSLKAIVAEVIGDRRGPGGHILTGPVYVEGAEAGDVLEVKVLSIDLPLDYGYNGCAGFLPENCDRAVASRIIPIDKKTMTAAYMPGIVIPLRPFFGSMGVAPSPDLGRVSSNPPSRHAGNLDNRELVAGSTLFIPVFVPGALFEVGDGHAAQGDGEIDGAAIETSFNVKFTVDLIKGKRINWPRLINDKVIMSIGSTRPLIDALRLACVDLINWLVEDYGYDKIEALQLLGQTAQLEIANVVDPQYSVACVLDKKYLPK